MSIYSRTLEDGGLGPNAPTVGSKIAYVVCTVLHALEPNASVTDVSVTRSVIDRLIALGVDPKSTAIRAMEFDLNSVIDNQRRQPFVQ